MASSLPSTPIFQGNLSPELQEQIVTLSENLLNGNSFCTAQASRLVLKHVSVHKREKDGKTQARVTYETTVEQDMTNANGTMHGGCAVYLIDACSSVALAILGTVLDKPSNFVSQALNTTFHAPTPVGAEIEIVNTTIAFGARTVSTITEIWDVTNGRLCMTGVHNKMAPSQPKL